MNLKALKIPFEAHEIEWRPQKQGFKNDGTPYIMVLAYVSNRAIMNRLDDVCGQGGWQNEYHTGANGGVLAGISVKCGNEWVTKYDGADNTQIEAVKGGLSGAMKRAGVQWGIGRYLYYIESSFAECSLEFQKGWNKSYDSKTKKTIYWKTPILPSWALPIDKKSAKEIENQIDAKKVNKDEFLKYFDVAEISHLTMEDNAKALAILQKK